MSLMPTNRTFVILVLGPSVCVCRYKRGEEAKPCPCCRACTLFGHHVAPRLCIARLATCLKRANKGAVAMEGDHLDAVSRVSTLSWRHRNFVTNTLHGVAESSVGPVKFALKCCCHWCLQRPSCGSTVGWGERERKLY